MTTDLPDPALTSLQIEAEETPPVRQRATIAETRLTSAEWGLLSILTLMQFSVTIDFIIIAPLGPQLMRVFGINTEQFGYTVAAYAFGAGLSSFSAAFFLDRFDRKLALLVLFSGFTLGTFCCALAPGYHAMLAARFITGIFGGVAGGVVLAIVGDAIPEKGMIAAQSKPRTRHGQCQPRSAIHNPMGTPRAEAKAKALITVPMAVARRIPPASPRTPPRCRCRHQFPRLLLTRRPPRTDFKVHRCWRDGGSTARQSTGAQNISPTVTAHEAAGPLMRKQWRLASA